MGAGGKGGRGLVVWCLAEPNLKVRFASVGLVFELSFSGCVNCRR